MNYDYKSAIVAALLVPLLAAFPLFASGYHLALAISLLSYGILAIAWGIFSGPTHYVSLATAAFFGIGAYTGAALGESLPWWLVIVVSGALGAVIALIVGLSTLRLSGIYFVIFTFGLAELIRQLVSWYEVTVTKSVGRYLFLSFTQEHIYWQLLALLILVILVGVLIGRSRYGFALRLIGDDEVAARHSGVDTTRAKLVVFTLSSVFLTVTGTIMAPRWTYIDPTIVFNPMMSFLVVIMALLGGTDRLLAPLLGVIPLVLLFDVLTATFPNYFSIVLGLIFIIIVYFVPNGVSQFIARIFNRIAAKPKHASAVEESRSPYAARATISTDAAPADGRCAPLLEVENLSRRFEGLLAVDNLSMIVHRGEIIGLIGPNGSGKTTALNLISGGLVPTSGTIRFDGHAAGHMVAYRAARLGIARTFQLVRVFRSMTCVENVLAGLAFRAETGHLPARSEAQGFLKRVGLGGKGDVRADQLTYIDQKRLELARALALNPKLLLLDEWLAGLNPSELHVGIDLIRSLRDDGVTIVMVEHVMDAIRSLCDRCVVMNIGRKIADGPPADALTNPEVVRAYLGEERDA